MNLVQNFLCRLRSLLNLKSWDYCVLWKLTDDQRFLEWMDCCCAGADQNIQNGGEELLFPVSSISCCRDATFQHSSTKSCDLLAELPSSMPLDSGICAQTLISNKARWLNSSNNLDSNALDTVGTRVLIPVSIGLVELFIDKQVPEDQEIIDYITAECSIFLEQQAVFHSNIMNSSFSGDLSATNENDDKSLNNPFKQPEMALENQICLPYDISVDRIRLCDSPLNFMQQFGYMSDSFKSAPQNGFQEIGKVHDALEKFVMAHTEESLVNKPEQQQGTDNKDSMKQEAAGRSESMSDYSDANEDEDDAKYRRRTGKRPKSKNLMAERKRRKKLNDRLYALRTLVPRISKLDKASILGDAIEFVKDLQKQVKDLQHELEEQSDDEGDKHNRCIHKSEIRNQLNGIHLGVKSENEKASNGFHMAAAASSGASEPTKQDHDSDAYHDKQRQMEPQVEVAQLDLGGNELFLKVFCEHKPGGVVRLMEVLNSLGLEVTNVNVTSFRSLISNVFTVEMRDSEMVEPNHVRDSLLEITRNPPRGRPEMAMSPSAENVNGFGLGFHPHDHRHQCPPSRATK